eukprot:186300_1
MAFRGRDRLVSFIMGDNVKRIEIEAFHFCTALRFIRFSKTLEYIGEFAFCYCSSLKWLFLPSTVKEIWSSAFNSCWSLRSIVLPNGIGLNKHFKSTPS